MPCAGVSLKTLTAASACRPQLQHRIACVTKNPRSDQALRAGSRVIRWGSSVHYLPVCQTQWCFASMSGPSERRAQVQDKYNSVRGQFPQVPGISAAELHELMSGPQASTVILIDARTEEEHEVSRIPGAISKAEFEAHRDDAAGKTLVAYCTVGLRSGKYLKPLQEQGFDTKNLSGSILAWTHENYPLVTGPGQGTPTKKVHTFSKDWSLQNDGYEPVIFEKARTYMEMARSVLPGWLGGAK